MFPLNTTYVSAFITKLTFATVSKKFRVVCKLKKHFAINFQRYLVSLMIMRYASPSSSARRKIFCFDTFA